MGAIGKHGGPEEVAVFEMRGGGRAAATNETGAIRERVRDMRLSLLQRLAGAQCAQIGGGVLQAIVNHQHVRRFSEFGEEDIINIPRDIDTVDGYADLAAVTERTSYGAFNGIFKISRFGDNHGAVAPEFQRHPLDRFACLLNAQPDLA